MGDAVATISEGTDTNNRAIPSYCPMAKYQQQIGRNLIPIELLYNYLRPDHSETRGVRGKGALAGWIPTRENYRTEKTQ